MGGCEKENVLQNLGQNGEIWVNSHILKEILTQFGQLNQLKTQIWATKSKKYLKNIGKKFGSNKSKDSPRPNANAFNHG